MAEMGSKKEISTIELRGEVYQCPSCGYTDGFHVAFRWDAEEGEIYLICPNCHSRFRTGWKVKHPLKEWKSGMSEFEIHSF
jgi:predicted RNA-binding Zn-ribbon protein involved in translation (DUF1610 family)